MNKDENAAVLRVQSSRRRYWWGGVAMLVIGAAALAGGAGFALMHGTEGDQATTAGVAAGFGFGLMIIGAMMAWCGRPGQPIDVAESRDGARREKLQWERTRQLVLFPLVLLLFMAQAHLAMQRVLGGDHNFGVYVQILLPVLYGWLIPVLVMGWDWNAQKNRRLMEDELTQVLRARSMILAFVVLMGGVTVALGLGLLRADYGVLALPYVLALGGASAGLRFAWLDREAGRDG
ncbi:hypothetical protein [uncultured Brevundimonas sp.]|uniref:hypothetical protein n=1 Tax=uncultured Brevundimonas sp. TaxID=213418 RepID=UPI0025D0E2A4|nr:hypothetical protein [uncultured Brevundimonas sp.]